MAAKAQAGTVSRRVEWRFRPSFKPSGDELFFFSLIQGEENFFSIEESEKEDVVDTEIHHSNIVTRGKGALLHVSHSCDS